MYFFTDVVPKKKRGRPKKVKADNIDGIMINTKIPANSVNIEKIINETALDSERQIFSPAMSKSMASQEVSKRTVYNDNNK